MPIREPMGRVVSGIACFTKFNPTSGESVYFDITFPWPKRLFFLKRCFIALRYELGLGRDLVMINTHNSAFDSTGALRQRELEILADYMRTEYQRGNYVIAGGDWNSNPRGFNPGAVSSGDSAVAVEPPMPSSFLPGWQFAFDSAVPSNRFLDEAYQRGRTRTTIIDFFVVSPNVEVEHVRTISDGFRYSDHHPVIMKFKLSVAKETP
jgi:endonuclease/exonuclease/phosphatase family metal-dependent hydrolase